MTGTDYLRIPVAAVPPDWVDLHFLPQVDRLLGGSGGLTWLPVDSATEAEYLLECAGRRVDQSGRPARRIFVEPADPLLIWPRLHGTPDEPGDLVTLHPREVLLVHGGELVPTEGLAVRLTLLDVALRSRGTYAIWPRFRSAVPIAPAHPTELPPSLDVPSLARAGAETLRGLVSVLARSRLPELPEDQRADLVIFILGRPLRSRAQVERWIDQFASVDPEGVPALLHELRGRDDPRPEHDPPHDPPRISTGEDLRSRFTRGLERLDGCRRRYATISSTSPLLADLFPLADPLQAYDPFHWFPSLVSYLSCLLFDSAGPELVSLCKYRYDPEIGDLVYRDDWFLNTHRQFTDLLRDLRTTMQHGMKRDTPRNDSIRDRVGSWYRLVCSQTEPDRAHARTLTDHLMRAWERYLDDLESVLLNLGSARSSAQVWSQVERDTRSLDRETFFRLGQEAVDRIDPRVTIDDKFKRKYLNRFRKELDSVCLAGEALIERAQRLIEKYVAAESDTHPVEGYWLEARRIPKGPIRGRLLSELTRHWESMRPPDAAEFLEYAEEYVRRYIADLELG